MTEVYLIIQHCDFDYGYGVVEEDDVAAVVKRVTAEHKEWHLEGEFRGPMCELTYETAVPRGQLETGNST